MKSTTEPNDDAAMENEPNDDNNEIDDNDEIDHDRPASTNEPRNKKKRKSRSDKRKKQEAADLEEEKRLTSLLFGGASTKEINDDENKDDDQTNYSLFWDTKTNKSKRGRPSAAAAEDDFHQNDDNDDDDDVFYDAVDSNNDTRSRPKGATAEQPLFQIDRVGASSETEIHHQQEDVKDGHQKVDPPHVTFKRQTKTKQSQKDGDTSNRTGAATAAWTDDDDDAAAAVTMDLLQVDRLRKLRTSRNETQPLAVDELEARLRQRYQTTMARTARTDWARLDRANQNNDQTKKQKDKKKTKGDNDEDEDDDDLVVSSRPLLISSSGSIKRRLEPNLITMVRCRDANQSDPSQSVVQCVHFHPGSSDPNRPLLLTAGLDKTLRFFHVRKDGSEKVHGMHCTCLDWITMTSC